MTPAGRIAATTVAPPAPPAKPGPERREDMDPASLTTEMDPISDVVQQKRKVDATLARFSAVHDEMAAEERQRRSRRMKLMPWLSKDDDLEEALTTNGPVSPASAMRDGRDQDEPEQDHEPEPARNAPRSKVPSRSGAKVVARRGRSMFTTKIAAGVAVVLVLVVAFFGWKSISGGSSTNTATGAIQEVAALDENSPAILESQKQYGDSNFLLVGTTSRPGAAVSGQQTTDTMMVLHIPVDGSRVEVVSFPPNLQVNRPACQQWNNQTNQVGGSVPAQNDVRLSSVYGTGGPRCLTDTVQQLSGLRINHFVGIDTNGFTGLVDSVAGGVPLCVKAPLKDSTLGTIVGQSGPVTLSGTQASNFVRADQIVGDSQPADLSRIQRQQRFLAAVVRKLIGQQNLLMNSGMLNTFLGTFTKSTFADNMGVDQLVKLATSLQGLAIGKITFVTLPTSGAPNAAGDETVDATASKQLFTAVIDNSPMPGETSSQQASSAAGQVSPDSFKIQVVNGSGTTNAATTTAQALRNYGFTTNSISDSPAPVTKTVIRYASGQQAQAALLASAVPTATLQVDPTMGGAIELVLGANFDHKVQAPHSGGTGSSTDPGLASLSYVNAADTSCA
jgi:LCP family protein required for cell wall assembly